MDKPRSMFRQVQPLVEPMRKRSKAIRPAALVRSTGSGLVLEREQVRSMASAPVQVRELVQVREQVHSTSSAPVQELVQVQEQPHSTSSELALARALPQLPEPPLLLTVCRKFTFGNNRHRNRQKYASKSVHQPSRRTQTKILQLKPQTELLWKPTSLMFLLMCVSGKNLYSAATAPLQSRRLNNVENVENR